MLKDVEWIPVSWDTSGLEYFAPIKQMPQIYEVAYKELRQKTTFPFIE